MAQEQKYLEVSFFFGKEFEIQVHFESFGGRPAMNNVDFTITEK